MKPVLLAAAVALLPLAACATGKAEIPDGVKRYTGRDDGCHSGGLGAGSALNLVNKTAAGATKGVVQAGSQGFSSFQNPVADVLYAPFGIVGGAFAGLTDGIGHAPADVSCHYTGNVFTYPWTRDYRVGTTDAQVPEHASRDGSGGYLWNGGAYWPGGPR
jgi:hypothetical protein